MRRPGIPSIVRRPAAGALATARRAGVRVLTRTSGLPGARPVASLGMRTLFDGLAGRWEDIRADPTYREGLREALALLPRNFRPKRALDSACGTGLAAGVLLDRWPGLAVHGTDISPRMIERAQQLVPDATFSVASVHELPFADGEFDLVVTLDGMLDIDELLRVTHRKGRIVVAYSRAGTTPISIPVDDVVRAFEELGAHASAHTGGQAHVVIARHGR